MRITPCAPEVAERHSGYKVGGTSPFNTRRTLPVYCEDSICELETLYINGGKRGYIVSLSSVDLVRVLEPTLVEVAV